MKFSPQDFSLSFLKPPRNLESSDPRKLRAAFGTWSRVWNDTIKELGIEQRLFSDSFTRQDEIMTIFHGPVCVGMLLLRFIDFQYFDFSTDSYFKVWEKADISRLIQSGDKIMISSYLTVLPSYRAKESGIKFGEIILDLMAQRFLISNCDSIAGITRRERKVHVTSYSLGAEMIKSDLPFFAPHDRVDLLVFERKKIRLLDDPAIRDFSDYLFSNSSKEDILRAA